MAVATTTAIAVAVAAATAAAAGVTASQAAEQANAAGKSQKYQIEAQQQLDALNAARAKKAKTAEVDKVAARQRAVLAANGQAGTLQGLALQQDTAEEGAKDIFRIGANSEYNDKFLKARMSSIPGAENPLAAGLFAGFGSAARSASSSKFNWGGEETKDPPPQGTGGSMPGAKF